MKTRNIIALFLIFALFVSFSIEARAGGITNTPQDSETTNSLKQLMAKFGTLMAGVEILRSKEKNPDWPSIDLSIKEMSDALAQMKQADKTQSYKKYTDMLTLGLEDLKIKSKKRDKNIYAGFDDLIHTCFQCHAMHRPTDFMHPKTRPTAKN